MKLKDVRLVQFKHDVGNLLSKVLRIQAECTEVCKEAQSLMEEFLDMIDDNEDDEE